MWRVQDAVVALRTPSARAWSAAKMLSTAMAAAGLGGSFAVSLPAMPVVSVQSQFMLAAQLSSCDRMYNTRIEKTQSERANQDTPKLL